MIRFRILSAGGLLAVALFTAGCENGQAPTMPAWNPPFERSNRDFNKPSGAMRHDSWSRTDYGSRSRGPSDSEMPNPRDKGGDGWRDARTMESSKAAVATIRPAAAAKDTNVRGTVVFTQEANGVRVRVELNGVQPNSKHGIHLHQKDDLSSADLKSAGDHFNPAGKHHGGLMGDEHHAGDLGNITADGSGHATLDTVVRGLSLDGPDNGVVGKSVIIHAGEDDLKTDPSGNSGDRIAGGAIRAGESNLRGSMDDRMIDDRDRVRGAAAEMPATRDVKGAENMGTGPRDITGADQETGTGGKAAAEREMKEPDSEMNK